MLVKQVHLGSARLEQRRKGLDVKLVPSQDAGDQAFEWGLGNGDWHGFRSADRVIGTDSGRQTGGVRRWASALSPSSDASVPA